MDTKTSPTARRIFIALIAAAVLAAAAWFSSASILGVLGTPGPGRTTLTVLSGIAGLVCGYTAAVFLAKTPARETEEVASEAEGIAELRRPLHVREELVFEDEAPPAPADEPVTEEEEAHDQEMAEQAETLHAPAPSRSMREPLDGLTLPELRQRLDLALEQWRGPGDPPASPPETSGSRSELRSALERLAALDNGHAKGSSPGKT